MSIETILSIIGFGLSVGSFFPLLFFKDRRREIAVVSLAAVICVVTAWHALKWYKYDKELRYVRSTLLSELNNRDLTYEEMQQRLGYINASLITNAIKKMLRDNEIAAKIVELHNVSGDSFDVRLYQITRIGEKSRGSTISSTETQ